MQNKKDATLRFALAQHDFPAGAVADNAAAIRALREKAVRNGAAVTVFPSLALSGSPASDLLGCTDFLAACERKLASLAAVTGEDVLILGSPVRHEDGTLCNAAAILAEGRMGPPGCQQTWRADASLEGARWFTPGRAPRIVDANGVRIAALVGDDIDNDAIVAQAARRGAELIVVIDASPWDGSCKARNEAILVRQARASGCAIAWINRVGGQDALLFDGGAMLVNPDGRVVARAPKFVHALLDCEFDPDTRCLRADNWPPADADSDEAVLHAGIVRGIGDYVRQTGFADVLIGLSGGIDSAVTLALAVDALGAAHVSAVMLPSRYTSEISLEGARVQAEALKVDYRTIAIEPAFKATLESLQLAFAGTEADTTEENLQARIRGTLLMALSNKYGKLLLATGNKSESAMGYATLYGDMCGAYAPLGDIYKTRVYRLARWRNAQGESAVIPASVIARPPSAELRDNQTDEDSLPPYAELDAILEGLIEQRQAPGEIIAAGHDAGTVAYVLRRLASSEFKRRQAAPAPRASSCALGHDRRYPINSGWR